MGGDTLMNGKNHLVVTFRDGQTFTPAGHTRWFIDENVIVIEYPDSTRCFPMNAVKMYEFGK